jgi:hypothetical protein
MPSNLEKYVEHYSEHLTGISQDLRSSDAPYRTGHTFRESQRESSGTSCDTPRPPNEPGILHRCVVPGPGILGLAV